MGKEVQGHCAHVVEEGCAQSPRVPRGHRCPLPPSFLPPIGPLVIWARGKPGPSVSPKILSDLLAFLQDEDVSISC